MKVLIEVQMIIHKEDTFTNARSEKKERELEHLSITIVKKVPKH